MKKYIAKKDTWFVEGSLCTCLSEMYEGAGLFLGARICQNPDSEGGVPKGTLYVDEEVCPYEEFDEVEGQE